MNPWLLVLTAGLGSFAFRFAMVALVDRGAVPGWFERGSAYVAPAAFAALVAVALARPWGNDPAFAVQLWLASGCTALVATRRPGHVAMIAGLGVLWMADALGAVAA